MMEKYISLFFIEPWCYLSCVDWTSSNCGQWIRSQRIFLSFLQTSCSQSSRESSLVFDLFSFPTESIYTHATLHIVFRSSLSLDVSQHHLLWSLHWRTNEQCHSQQYDVRSTVHLCPTGLLGPFLSLSDHVNSLLIRLRSSLVWLWKCWALGQVFSLFNSFDAFDPVNTRCHPYDRLCWRWDHRYRVFFHHRQRRPSSDRILVLRGHCHGGVCISPTVSVSFWLPCRSSSSPLVASNSVISNRRNGWHPSSMDSSLLSFAHNHSK